MTNHLFLLMSKSCNMKRLDFKSKILFDHFDFNIFTNCCMPVRAHTPHGMLRSRYFPQRSIFRSEQGSLFLSTRLRLLLALLLPLRCTHLVLYIHACTRKHTSTHSFSHSPPTHTHTQTVARSADVCPDLLPAQALLMPAC